MHKSMEKNWQSGNTWSCLQSTYFQQQCQDHSIGKRIIFLIYGVGKTVQPDAKEWNWSLPSHHTKINLKQIKYLNVEAIIIKFIEENRQIFTSLNSIMASYIWHQKHKQQRKTKLDIKNQEIVCFKDTIKKAKGQSTELETILTNHIYVKELYLKYIYIYILITQK